MTTIAPNTAAAIAEWRRAHPGEQLVLKGAYLGGTNLRRADLRGSNLHGATVRGADLRGANLNGAILTDTNLCGANLGGAAVRGADLRGANLCGADLGDANLGNSNLSGADLSGSDLSNANLSEANLAGTNLTGANLSRAKLSWAKLTGANLGDNHVWQFGPIGSRSHYLVISQGPNLDWVTTGCFMGTLAEFEAAVAKTHGDNKYGQAYRIVIAAVKNLITLAEEDTHEPAKEEQPSYD